MTASFTSPTDPPHSPSAAASIVIGVIAAAVVLGLFVAGLTFFALAIAFPIAVPVANQYHVVVSAADAALAERFSEFWWVFAAFGFASLGGAVLVAVKAVQALSPAPRD